MAIRPEVLAQLARILGDDALRSASDEEARERVDQLFDQLVARIVAEAADSEAVYDSASARAYLESRLRDLAVVLSAGQVVRIRKGATDVISAW